MPGPFQMRNITSSEGFGVVTDVVDLPLDVAYVTFEIFGSVLGTVSNACVIYVFVKHKAKKCVTNYMYYLLSLAVADLFVGLLAVPIAVLNSVGLPKHYEMCLAMNSVLMMLCVNSVFSLVALSMDRYVAVLHPVFYRNKMTLRRSLYTIGTSWLIAVIVGLLPVFGWNRGRPPVPRCLFVEVMGLEYLLFISVAAALLPSLIMTVVYTKVSWAACVRIRNQRTVQSTSYPQAEVRITKTLTIVIVLFVCSWVPLCAINTVSYFCPDCPVPEQLLKFTIFLTHFNSFWNPVIYAWRLKNFRAELHKLLHFRCSSQSNTAAEKTTTSL